jgi:hypothetical protein
MTEYFKKISLHIMRATILLLFLFSLSYTIFNLCFPQKEESEAKTITEIKFVPYPEVHIVETEVETVVYVEPEDETALTFEDIKLLASIVCAEAGNQDFIGKRLVADVVLNRYYDSAFPDTISGVIFAEGQFNATIYMSGYTEMDLEAVCMELKQRLDPDIFYFANTGFHEGHKKAYQHGDHYFSYK